MLSKNPGCFLWNHFPRLGDGDLLFRPALNSKTAAHYQADSQSEFFAGLWLSFFIRFFI
jgi:hypothetical protein